MATSTTDHAQSEADSSDIGEQAVRERGPGADTALTRRRLHVARAELVLAAAPSRALREVPLKPDPLQSFAAAVTDVRPSLSEHVEVCLDLLPLTAAASAHLRRRAAQAAVSGAGGGGGLAGRAAEGAAAAATGGMDLLLELLDEFIPGHSGGPAGPRANRPAAGTPTRAALAAAAGKFTDPAQPLFGIQVMIRVESEIPERAAAHLHQVLAAFDAWRGENWWRVRGLNLGFRHVGADSWLYRRWFDHRWTTGLFQPGRRRRNVVTAAEIAGLLKPPTKHNEHFNVLRSGGRVPPPPRGVPIYTGQRDVIPVGYAPGPDGRERLYGMPMEELFFSFRVGKSRYGKTETALVQAVAMARAGHGVWFLDPHADGWTRARTLLTDPQVAARLWEINLTIRDADARIAGYNPLSMAGQAIEHIEDRVDAVVTGFSSALGWGDSAPRAKTILTKACETLCHLALRLPEECAPTIFQIRTILDDADWRQAVLPLLSDSLQRYWDKTYPKYPADATPTITNVIERLAASPTLSALFGSSRSTYDVRHAMDTGKIVFLCPPGGDIGRLVSCLLIYDLFRAGRSRVDTPSDRRRRFDAYVDELTAVDGAARGHLAGILEQLAKYGLRLHAMTQMAQRLTAATRDALLQNQSMLSSTASELDAARLIAKQWSRYIEPQTLVDLPRFHHVVAVTLDGQVTTPFKVRGPVVTELFADQHHPERIRRQADIIDENLDRRRVRDILQDLETLDRRILQTLGHSGGDGASDRRAGSESSNRSDGRRRSGTASGGAAQPAQPSRSSGYGTPMPAPATGQTPPTPEPGGGDAEGRWSHDIS